MNFFRVIAVATSALLVFNTHAIAVNPERGYKAKPNVYGMEFSEIKIKTPDAALINVWIFEPATSSSSNNAMTIILASGDSGNMGYLLTYADGLRKQGFRVVSFDYRGFGESSEFATSRDMLYYDEFMTDMNSVIAHARGLYPKSQIGVMGFSMGTIFALTAASKNLSSFTIVESAVTNVPQLVARWSSKGKTLRYPPSGTALEQTIKKVRTPILLFAGKADTITALNEAKTLLLGHESTRRLVEYAGGHLEGWKMGNDYFAAVKNFVQQYCLR